MPRTAKGIKDISLLAAALEGLELQKRRLDDQIAEVRSLLGKGTGRREARSWTYERCRSQTDRCRSETPLGRVSQVGW